MSRGLFPSRERRGCFKSGSGLKSITGTFMREALDFRAWGKRFQTSWYLVQVTAQDVSWEGESGRYLRSQETSSTMGRAINKRAEKSWGKGYQRTLKVLTVRDRTMSWLLQGRWGWDQTGRNDRTQMRDCRWKPWEGPTPVWQCDVKIIPGQKAWG